MKYKKHQFDTKYKKRNIEKAIVEKCIEHKIKGNYIGLVGPAYINHIENWSKISNKFQSIEIDNNVYLSQLRQYKKYINLHTNLKNICRPIKDDIFNYLYNYKGKVTILDLDFCGMYETLEEPIYQILLHLLHNNQFTVRCNLNICLTLRKGFKGGYDTDSMKETIINDIIDLFKQYNYSYHNIMIDTYKEGAPMIELSFIFNKEYKRKVR